jgi:carbon-monoxide dehydrogenase small subunit/xanthine dehydrogenase small subunit
MTRLDAESIPLTLTLNGREVNVAVAPADRLLDALRYRLGLTGTKEGCGEGECGACTVVLDGMPVNSCLVPAYQCAGRDIRTIESVRPEEVEPLLRSGATQCGACTPGVVMTARWIRDRARQPAGAAASGPSGRSPLLEMFSIRELMAGNLCRCTGYDGIIEGIEGMLGAAAGDGAERRAGSWPDPPASACHARRATRTARVRRPVSLGAAVSALAADRDLVPIAGGTDLLVHWPTNLPAHDRAYLDLSPLEEELRPIRWTDSHLVLGALTTYWDAMTDRRVVAEFPLLLAAGRQVGAVQIQARGTWAGNIANGSPAADGVPVLMAYGATVELSSEAGVREVPLETYHTGYRRSVRRGDELITAIRLPRRDHGVNIFEKVGPRAAQAITKVGVAITREASRGGKAGAWRVVANSVAPTVKRCPAVEGLLAAGVPLRSAEDLLPAIRRDVSPIDDLRSTAGYREQVLARLIYHCLRDAAGSVA